MIVEAHAESAGLVPPGLEEGTHANGQMIRLRYLAAAFNDSGQAKQAFAVIERAQRMAELLGDSEEQIRLKATLAATDTRTFAYEDAARLYRECVQACDEGIVNDPMFQFRRLSDPATRLTHPRPPKQAHPGVQRAGRA